MAIILAQFKREPFYKAGLVYYLVNTRPVNALQRNITTYMDTV